MKSPKQLELFAGADKGSQVAGKASLGDQDADAVHALGLLGWKDPLWSTRFTIELLDGSKLTLTLATLRRATQVLLTRQLHAIARAPILEPPQPPGQQS